MGGIIEYAANGGKARGYLARPDGGGVDKGVIVIQEWWGLADHIKDVCDRFAREGYAALAPDLWDGTLTKKPDEAQRLLMALNIDDATKKIRGAAAALRGHGASGKLGVVGFCMGGQLALYAGGELGEDLGAVIDFYGIHPRVRPNYGAMKAPVMVMIGDQDESVPPAVGREIKANVEKTGGTCELHVYSAGHAFFNDARPEAYHAESATDAWRKTLDFFGRHL